MADTAPISRLTLRLFGAFEARSGDVALPRLRTRKGQWLLALLALRPGAQIERAWLAGLLWPDSAEAAALANLRSVLQDLRQTLGTEADRLRSPTTRTLSLDLAGADVDVREFDAAIKSGDPASLQRAVELYRGPLLEDCCEEWLFPERQAREQAYLEALETLAHQALAGEDAGAAERWLRRAVAVDPLRESAQRALMQVLAADGNAAAALLVYRELRQRLHREINTAPDAETTALYQQLRAEARQRAQPSSAASLSARLTSPVRPPSPPLPTGETLTFLFTDIEGSVRHWEEQPEAMSTVLARHDTLLRQAIETQGGVVFKRVGDAFCAAFATAPEAIAAALAGQCALRELGSSEEPADNPKSNIQHPILRVRMALHTGAAEQRDGDYFGPALNRVSRLLETGHGGQVLLSQPAYELARDHLPEGASLRDLGEHRLKDLVRPERVFQLIAAELPADFPPLRSLETFRHNLPLQLTSFVGREREMQEVRRLLNQSRLLTLTGAGGSGKTRLSLQVAADLVEEYPDGIWLVELASLSDEGLVAQAVVSVLGLREEPGRPLIQALIDHLAQRQLLLVLDNCEHVIAACAALAESLLRNCPRLRILASSREPLSIAGEMAYRVPSLPLPDLHHLPTAGEGLVPALTQYGAVQLFIDRVTSTLPTFSVTNRNAPAVAEVCHRLDGIPLAIELAAARVKSLPIEQLAARLDDRFRLLTGGSRTALRRHQTLRALIDWSYDLLSEPERLLLARLSVFAGGWTLEAAEAVCAGEGIEAWEALDLLTALVEKSLAVYEEREGQARYRLLETMRQYARDRLLATGEAPIRLERHYGWFLALAERAEPELEGAEQGLWLTRLERDHDNFRAALSWAAETERGGPSDAPSGLETGTASLRLAGALAQFWGVRGHLTEGRRWLEGALASSGGESQTPRAARAKALAPLGYIAWRLGDYETARARCEEGAAMARELADKPQLARALVTLGHVAFSQGDYASARASQAESLALSQELSDRSGIAGSLFLLGHLASLDLGNPAAARSHYEESLTIYRELGNKRMIAWLAGNRDGRFSWGSDHTLGRAYQEEALAIFRELGDLWGIAYGLRVLGDIAYMQRELVTAQAYYEEGLQVARQLGDKPSAANLLSGLGRVARRRGDYEEAQRCHEEALAIRRDCGARMASASSLWNLGEVAMAQGHWGEAKALFEEADAIDREHAIREGYAFNAMGRVALKLGDTAEARRIFEEDLAIKREVGEKYMVAANLHGLGDLCVRQGEYERACSFAKESLAIRQELADKRGICASLELLAAAAAAQGQPQRAARLLGAAEGLRDDIGTPRPPAEHADYARNRGALLDLLGNEAVAAAWAEGRAMTLEEAVEYALAETSLLSLGKERRETLPDQE